MLRAMRLLGFSLAALLVACSAPIPSQPDAAREDAAPLDSAIPDVVTTTDSATLDATSAMDASADSATADASSSGAPIGEWTDAPGQCPAGYRVIDVRTNADLSAATRGEGAFAGGAATCYLIHNGTYSQNGAVLLWFQQSGSASQPIVYVGESRAGVIIHARATFGEAARPVRFIRVENLTFDLRGYSNGSSPFNTLDILASTDITVSHVTFTGDCTVGHNGGHIETTGAARVLVEACLLENYGQCGPNGHQDHGVYLAGGTDLTFRNNVIRGNASRGIQLYSPDAPLRNVVIEDNRIYDNGHAAYEDGIVINPAGQMLDGLIVRRNVIYRNFYSGVRFVGADMRNVSITGNTFANNGERSTTATPSSVNLDDASAGANATITLNLFASTRPIINQCYTSATRALSIRDNFASAAIAAMPCVSEVVVGDPMFADAASGDFHPNAAAAQRYGAYRR